MDFLPSKQRYLNRAHLSDRFSRLGKLSAMALKTRNFAIYRPLTTCALSPRLGNRHGHPCSNAQRILRSRR